MNNRTKFSIAILTNVVAFATILTAANFNNSFSPAKILANDVCTGNHYIAKHETFSEDGLNEMWICCKHHEVYNFIDEINDYDSSNWTDINESFPSTRKDEIEIDDRKDKAFRKAAFSDVTTYGDATVDLSTKSITIAKSGFALTNKTYNDVEFSVNFSVASTNNPYFDYKIKNSLLLGAGYSDNKLTGFVIDVSKTYIQLHYLDGAQDDIYTSAGCLNNNYKDGNYSKQDLSIKIAGFHLTISNASSTLIDCDLVFSNNIVYAGGGIGFIGNDATNSQLSFSNLVYKDAPTFKASADNDWTFDKNTNSSFKTSSKNGYILSREKYNSFNAHIYVDRCSNYNSYLTTQNITPRNAFVFGANENSDGTLSGYALDIEGAYAFLLKIENGIASKPFGEKYVTIDTNNKSVEISFVNSTITVTSKDTITQTIESYSSGSVGYLSNQVAADNDYGTPYNVRITGF